MTEEELQKKRQEFRDQEVATKISQYSTGGATNAYTNDYRQQVIKSNYTYRRVDRRLGKMGLFIVISQSTMLLFFSTLFLFSYIPHTKKFVTMIMP